MSLSDFLRATPSLEVGTIQITVDLPVFGREMGTTSNISVGVPISLSNFPDIRVGGSGNDLLQGNAGGPNVSFPVSLQVPVLIPELEFSGFPPRPRVVFRTRTATIDSNLSLPDTANDFLFGFGGNDTLNGDSGNDLIIGDSFAPNDGGFGNDILNGDNGDDILIAGGGNDTLNGGTGNDILFGDYFLGLGFDIPLNFGDIPIQDFSIPNIRIFPGVTADVAVSNVRLRIGNFTIPIGSGNEGNDFLSAGAGNDLVFGDLGNDTLNGDEGNDALYAGAGNDILNGGQGDDILSGDDGIDTVTYRLDPGSVTVTLGTLSIPGLGSAKDGFGNQDQLSGIENVIGSSFNDLITGDTNNNVITAGAGDDIVSAGGGNDTLFGEEGNDFLDGGDGDDVLNGGLGGDILIGGLFGSDTASYSTSVIEVSVSLTTGTGISGDARGDWLIDIENLEGSNFGDILTGNFSNNIIRGLGGDDKISGEAGDDLLNGQLGNDFLFGGLGNDQLFGEADRDVLFGEAGNDQLLGGDDLDELDGGAGDDRLFGEAGNDKLFGKEGNDQLFGGTDNDTIDGGTGVDILWGDGGNDILLGKAENDALNGGDGNDELYGDEGDDILEGGIGQDQLYGGASRDLFVFSAGAGADTIFDFQVGQDVLGLKNSLTFGQLAVVQGTGINANNTLISIQASSELLATLIGVGANTLAVQSFVSV